MNILAIDPGNEQSAWCYLEDGRPVAWAKEPNDSLLWQLENEWLPEVPIAPEVVVIEKVESFGMAVGKEVFETVFWSGRFAQACSRPVERIGRKDVKLHLCHSLRAKDSNIRQACIDRFPATGGGKVPQIGVKANPGPLFGMSKDCWSALAVGITYHDRSVT